MREKRAIIYRSTLIVCAVRRDHFNAAHWDVALIEVVHFVGHAPPKTILIWEEVMSTLVGFGTFSALLEERISEKISRRILSGDQGMIVWWSIRAGVHVEPHSHANEQIVWMLKGKMEFRLGSEQRVCSPGDVLVIPGGAEHEAWFREDTSASLSHGRPRASLPSW